MNKAATSFAASTLAIATLLCAQSAHATGVTAGTLIQNTASASYTSGTATTTVKSNTVTVKVDELLDVAVTSLDGSPQQVGQTTAILSYRITNTGNGPEAYKLFADAAVSGNVFDATVQTLAYDSNGNGIYDPGVDTVVTNGGSSPELSADGSLAVFVVVSVPASAADGVTSQVRLTAYAASGTGPPGTVFAAQGFGGGDAVVGASTASSNALGQLIASLAAVTLTKSFTIVDPFGGSQPVPGALVTFAIRADATGSGKVTSLHVTDGIPAGSTYKPGTLKLEGASLSDATDTDSGIASASGVDVTVGTLTGGSSRTVTFSTVIN